MAKSKSPQQSMDEKAIEDAFVKQLAGAFDAFTAKLALRKVPEDEAVESFRRGLAHCRRARELALKVAAEQP
jgi:hypothetical protein